MVTAFSSKGILTLIAFACYLVMMIGIGVFNMRKTKTTEDYFLGAWGFDDGGYREYCTPWSGLAHIRRPDGLYKAVPRFSLYRWHVPDPIRFKQDVRVTVQDLGWRSGGRYLSRRDDISTVAYWYQSEPFTDFPPFPSRDALEIV